MATRAMVVRRETNMDTWAATVVIADTAVGIGIETNMVVMAALMGDTMVDIVDTADTGGL